MNYWELPRAWEGRTVAVLASGSSLTKEDAGKVGHLPRIAINATYRMAPDADIVYGSDTAFWVQPEYAGVHLLGGLRCTVEQVPGVHPSVPSGVGVLRNGGRLGFSDRQDTIRTGGNSAYAAIHIAALMGAKRIIVLGLDLCGEHWHGDHPQGLNNPKEHRFRSWIRNFRTLEPELTKRGIEVFNCSPITALDTFPRAALASLL